MHIQNGGSLLPYIGIMFLQILNLSIITTAVTIVGSLMFVFVKNKYVVQISPLLYYFITLILASTVGNINSTFGKVLTIFVMDEQILSIVRQYFTKDISSYSITNSANSIIFITVLSVISLALYRRTIIKFGKDYIL